MNTPTQQHLKRSYSSAMYGRINSYRLDSLFIVRKPDLKVSQKQKDIQLSLSLRRIMMNKRAKTIFLLVLGCLLFMLSACDILPTPAPVCEAVYTVNKSDDTNDGVCSGGDCSLREAVDNANACPGNQTINLPADAYILTIDGDNEDLNATGDLDITDDLVIIGTGAPSINGHIERAFHIHSGIVVTMDGIWLTDGDAIYGGGLVNEGFLNLNDFTCNYNNVSIPPGGMGDAMGGCIFNTGVTHINNGHFLENTAGYGGAIYNLAWGAVEVVDSSLTGNSADNLGGAVWNDVDADIHLYTSTLEQNQAGYRGGAVWSHGTVNLDGTVIIDNQAADFGGGIYLWEGFATVDNSWLTLNTAGAGAGVYNEDGMIHFSESGLTANTATTGMGGGIYNNGLSPSNGILMYNTTISANSSVGGGAGIYNNGQFDLRFVTIADNNPEGLRIDGGLEIKIRSSILSNNSGGDCAGISPDSLDYNLTSDSTCTLAGSHDIVNVTALIEPLGFYGSTAPSHPLTYGSPAIDSGVPDLCISQDQNFVTRPQGAGCDRGAFEDTPVSGLGGSISGWTYIDANRNDIYDPTDGWMTGVWVDLHAGICPPAGSILETAESDSTGFYEFMDLAPGDYCLQTSPLQQTLYPEDIQVSVFPGDAFTEVNFRYLLSPLGDASISGLVWHDLCAVPYATPATPPPGCIWLPGGGLGADGIYIPSEPGIEGVKVKVYSGACPGLAPSIAAEVFTDIAGEYTVPSLGTGTYCVVVDDLNPNDTILIPGSWTYPVRDADPAESQVVLGAAEVAEEINFGWDYQLLPPPAVGPTETPTPVPEVKSGEFNKNAFCRQGPATIYNTSTAHEKGTGFIALARSEDHLTRWYWIEDLIWKIRCWVSFSVVDLEIDGDKLPTRIAPPTPTYTPTPPPPRCDYSLNESDCIAAGGEWKKETCICP